MFKKYLNTNLCGIFCLDKCQNKPIGKQSRLLILGSKSVVTLVSDNYDTERVVA